jgi:biopolymer transport protein ExbB
MNKAIIFTILIAFAAPLSAQEVDLAAQAAQEESMDVFTLLIKGGWVMIPIALASVLALTITIERFLSLRRKKIVPPEFVTKIKDHFNGNEPDADKGAQFCKEHPSPLSNMIHAALPKLKRGEIPLQHALEEAGAREVDRMKRSLKPLSMIATVAPLLGLLGTVYGMISAFQAASGAGTGKSDVLAQGIYEALVTTAAGLTLAIPVLIVYMVLNNKVDNMVDYMDQSAEEFMGLALK